MKIKYDVSNSDPDKAQGGDFEQPKPGVYKAKVLEVNDTHPKNPKTGKPDTSRNMLEVVYEITDKKYTGSRLWDYIVDFDDPDSASIWKFDQFLLAFGFASKKKRKGTFDTDDAIGEACKLRVKADSYNKEYRAKVGAVIAVGDEDDDDGDLDDDELEDELEDELDEDDIEENEDLEEEDEDLEEEEEADEVSGDYLTEDDLSDMTLAHVQAIARDDFEIDPLPRGKSKVIAAILDAQAAPEEEEEEDEVEYDDGYDEMSIADLKAELADRELKTTGKKDVLIYRLREDDAEEPF